MVESARYEAWKSLGEKCIHSAKFDCAERQVLRQSLPDNIRKLSKRLHTHLHRIYDSENYKTPIIWLSDDSSSRTSAAAHMLAQELHDNSALAATFFFSRKEPLRNTADHVIPTISYQLGLLHHRAKDVITKAIIDNPQLLKRDESRNVQFTHLVLRPLQVLKNIWKESGNAMFMVFGAIDECDPGEYDSHVRQLLDDLVGALQQSSTADFQIIFTSRRELYIQKIMAEYPLVLPLKLEVFDVENTGKH
ncbi:hypothetical protein CONPUDRAFT_151583 [Coniophora puteana RWD-64-598 SS2]|uniref:Nephrocystin 3-like N-terminal domain-containing protein n=1 Tax=Coniophora puteana (strain RWD-64-598) TaxID=741705 RepID=R7SD73_CONPW|nr:uncharacterized protein CONPUDRAFT_151583 [Coniophora puteana RWD-64-598 SS2]XP_007776018.1 uncharacterized protein CONPUDRAFT_160695 [Coniophora puteana RWD-64-598 SS2]EIW73805.1 hypothetical protein CONPUDRAFT_160695 [Coniophora puteana RWD-64-598 SS2]EIW84567.1 hypothetical protein CONPUDRAFT_151583 [Coniophora puteana RWD-64-598 SS2]